MKFACTHKRNKRIHYVHITTVDNYCKLFMVRFSSAQLNSAQLSSAQLSSACAHIYTLNVLFTNQCICRHIQNFDIYYVHTYIYI